MDENSSDTTKRNHRDEQHPVVPAEQPEASGIYLNDELLGITPVRKELEAGSPLIKAIKEGYEQKEMTTEVFGGSEEHLFITLQKFPGENPDTTP